jgi:6-phosphogluconate dehydrogenase
MVHNGIEYGIMAAYAEGLNVLNKADAHVLSESPLLEEFGGFVSDSGEGRWTVLVAVEEGVPVPVLSTALYERFSSRGEAQFADKLLSAMRKEFGGHTDLVINS